MPRSPSLPSKHYPRTGARAYPGTITTGSQVGYKLYREIKDHAPDDWTAGERLIALIIADDASDRTRCSRLPLYRLLEQSGYQDRMVRKLLARLAERGFEFRVSSAAAKDGRPVFATKGHAVSYRVPHMLKGGNRVPPLPFSEPVDNSAKGGTSVPPSEPKGGTPVPPTGAKGGTRVPQRRHSGAAPFPQPNLTTGVPVVSGAVEVSGDSSGQEQRQGGDVAAAVRVVLPRPMSKLELAAWQVIESRRQRQQAGQSRPAEPGEGDLPCTASCSTRSIPP